MKNGNDFCGCAGNAGVTLALHRQPTFYWVCNDKRNVGWDGVTRNPSNNIKDSLYRPSGQNKI